MQITPHRTHACAHFSRCVSHLAHFIQCTCVGSRCLILCVSLKSSHPRTMSPLGVPQLSAFPPVMPSSTKPPTALTGIGLNPCATPLWGGPSGHLADPTPSTGYEPKFCIDVSSEHAPVHLPSRKISFNLENDATVAASEDFDLSSTFTSKQQPALGSKHCSHLVETRLIGLQLQETGCRLRCCCKLILQHQETGSGRGSRNCCEC